MQKKYEGAVNKFVAVILVMVLTLADLITLGLNFVSLAIDVAATNSNNIEFVAYFKDKNGEKVNATEETLNTESFNMYVDVSVLREGYFNGKISLENSNLKIKDVTKNLYVSSFENNTINLNQINSGKTATIEIQVTANTSTTMNEDVLNKITTVKIDGLYVHSKGSDKIEGTSTITAKFISPNSISSLLDVKLLSNKIYNIDGTNKRILQIAVKSKIQGNTYPAKNTTINISIPTGAENIEVTPRTTAATNKRIEFGENNYIFNQANSNVQITIDNNKDKDGNISFEQNAKDEFVVTCIYPENKEFKEENQNNKNEQNNIAKENQIKVFQSINTYDGKTVSANKEIVIEKELDGIISYEISEQENEFYKGKIYSGEERIYNENMRSYINTVKTEKNISFSMENTNYIAGENKKTSKITYKEIKIKKEELIKILGEEGYITIKDENGTVFGNLSKESQTDENGFIVIAVPESTYKININTSNVKSIGKIDIKVSKSIIEKEYKQDEIKDFTGIENKIISNNQEINSTITLKETSTEAMLEINKSKLQSGENENIQMKVTLLSNDESKDLYKNPTIKIAFPEDTAEVSAKYKMLYGNGLEKNTAVVKEEEGKKVLEINLQGEQEEYPGKVIDGTNILVNANIKMNSLSTSKDEDISLSYTNENASNYANEGIATRSLNIAQALEPLKSNAGGETEQNTEPQEIDANMMISYISEQEKVQSNTFYDMYLFVKNNTSTDIENVEVRFFTNNLFSVDRIFSENVDNNGVLHISKINANETETVFLKVKALKPTSVNQQAEIYSKISAQDKEYTSNKLRKTVEDIDAKMTITTTPQVQRDGDLVRYGEKVDYTINVSNIGVDDINQMKLDFELSDFADVEKVEVGNKECEYNLIQYENSITRKISINIADTLKSNNNLDIKITTKVKKADASSKQMSLMNTAYLYINDKEFTNQTTKAFGIYELVNNEDSNIGSTITDDDLKKKEQEENKGGVISDEDLKEKELKEDDTPETITEEDLKSRGDVEEGEENEGDEGSSESNNQEGSTNGKDSQGQNASTNKENQTNKYSISGKVWLDENQSADKKQSNKGIQGIKIKLVNSTTGNIQNNSEGTAILAETNDNGEYTLNNIPEGKYIVVFDYDTNKYKLTEYQKEGISPENNSDAILKELEISGEKTIIAATDILEIKENKQNIDLGLIETKKFDLELTKTINKVTVTNKKGTKEYTFKDSVLAKVEIEPKELDNTKIEIEYTIKVKNTGEISGYAKKIIDYIPSDLEFSQERNEGWVKDGEYINNTKISNDEIKVGETKELKLILTKTMTSSNTGLISNVAEIAEASNNYEKQDTDSTPGNRKAGEDDLGQADIIIGVKTGIITRVVSFITVIIILSCAVYLVKLKKNKS